MEEFNIEDYQKKAHETCQPQCFNEDYLQLGLISEIGEIAGKLKRVIRDGDEIDNEDMIKELGDVLWYATELIYLREQPFLIPTVTFGLERLSIADLVKHLSIYSDGKETRAKGVIFVCLSMLAEKCGANLQKVAEVNIKKLADRKKRNQINGSGDNR